LDELGRYIDGTVAEFRLLLPAPPELVWEYLTNSDALPEWLGDGKIGCEVGASVVLRSGGPVIRGTILEIDKPSRLAYSWNVYMPGDEHPAAPESTLSFELEPHADGTVLRMSNGPILPEYRARTIAGWHALLELLEASLADQPRPDFMESFQRVYPDYEKLYS
jgi:uncharacterized protein YndB with AHSA1/START domain